MYGLPLLFCFKINQKYIFSHIHTNDETRHTFNKY